VDGEKRADLLGLRLPIGRLGVAVGELVVFLEQGADLGVIARQQLDGIGAGPVLLGMGFRDRCHGGSLKRGRRLAPEHASCPLGPRTFVGQIHVAPLRRRRLAVGLGLQRAQGLAHSIVARPSGARRSPPCHTP
jgi:hypothetical protein